MQSVEPYPDVPQPIETGVREDQNQSDPQIPAASTTMVETATDEITPEPHSMKLTLVSSLSLAR